MSNKILFLILITGFTSFHLSGQNTSDFPTLKDLPHIEFIRKTLKSFPSSIIEIRNAKNRDEYFEVQNKFLEHKFGKLDVDFEIMGSNFYTVKRNTINVIHISIKNTTKKFGDFKTIYFDITKSKKLKS